MLSSVCVFVFVFCVALAVAADQTAVGDGVSSSTCPVSGIKVTLQRVRVFRTCSSSPVDAGFSELGLTALGTSNAAVDTEFDCRLAPQETDVTRQGYVRIDVDIEIPIREHANQADWCPSVFTQTQLGNTAVSLGGVSFGTQQLLLRQALATPYLRYPLMPRHFVPHRYRNYTVERTPSASAADMYCSYSVEMCRAHVYSASCQCDEVPSNCIVSATSNASSPQYECFGESVPVTYLVPPVAVPKGAPQPCVNPGLFPAPGDVSLLIDDERYVRDYEQRAVPACRVLQCGTCPEAATAPTRAFFSYIDSTGAVFEPDAALVPTVNDSVRFRAAGTVEVWVWEYDGAGGLTPGGQWAYLHVSVDSTPQMVFAVEMRTSNFGDWRAVRTRNKDSCGTATTPNWESTGVCTGNAEGPVRACDCAQFPSVLRDASVLVTENEGLLADDTPIDGAPLIGGSLLVRVDVARASFSFRNDSTYTGAVFDAGGDWGWEDGNAPGGSGQCAVTVPSGGRQCTLVQNPRDGTLDSAAEHVPHRWFHGYHHRRRLHVGETAHAWGSQPNSEPNVWENGNVTFSAVSTWNQAQLACRRRRGSFVPGVDFWSVELGDRSLLPDQLECGWTPDGGTVSAGCTVRTPGIGSALPMDAFFTENADAAADGKRPKHLPPRTFTDLGVPDAWIAFDRMTTLPNVADDRPAPYVVGAPFGGATAPYLVVAFTSASNDTLEPVFRRRYTYRVPAHLLRATVVETAGQVGYPPDGPPTEAVPPTPTTVEVEVVNRGTGDAAFDVAIDCGDYASVNGSSLTTTHVMPPGGTDIVTFLIVPIVGTSANASTCTVTLYNNVGRAIGAPFTVTVQNSTVVTTAPPPATLPPLTPVPTVAPTPTLTPAPTPKPSCFLGFWCSAPDWVKALLFIVLPAAIVMLILYTCLIANRDPTKEELARAADQRLTDALPEHTLSSSVQVTEPMARSMEQQVVLAREMAATASPAEHNLRRRHRFWSSPSPTSSIGGGGGGFYA